MAKLNIIGPGYEGRSKNINASRSVNFYPEANAPGSSTIASLIGTPGTTLFSSIGPNIIRGMHVFNNLIYFVSGNKLYSISINKDLSSQIGDDLDTEIGRVVFSDNGLAPTGGNDLVFSDGAKIYTYDVISANFTATAITAHTNCFVGGYFVADSGGGKFRVSNLYDGETWNALNVATAEASPDSLLAVVNNHGELWLFGEYTTEVWYQLASGSPPFARVSGGVIDYGCAARHSVAKGNNTVVWLGTKRNNDQAQFVGVCMAQGYNVEIISPPSINYKIDNYTSIDDAFAYFYTDEGHEFYVLTFPNSDATWVYDTTTGMWHERSTYKDSPYNVGRHISNSYCVFNRRHFVGDYQSGNIYEMSSSYYTDADEPLVSFRTTDHLYDDANLGNVFISKLQLDVEGGVGIPAEKIVLNGIAEINTQVNPKGLADDGKYIWVCNETTGTVSKINKNTNIVDTNVALTVDSPRHILYAGGYIWVLNYRASTGAISKIDITTNAVTTIDIGGLLNDLVYDGSAIWVAVGADDTVVKINTTTNVIDATVAVGSDPKGLLFDDTSLWVTNNTSANVSKVNISTNAVDATIAVGNGPTFMVYADYALWVLNYTDATVSKINTVTDTVSATLSGITGSPNHILYSNNYIWVADETGSSLRKFDKTTDALDATIAIDTTPFFICSDGDYLWVANKNGGQISKVDIVNETETLLSFGTNSYHIIFDGDYLWVTDPNDNSVFKIQPYTEAASVNPQAILSWSKDGGHTWSNEHSSSLGKQGEYTKRAIWRRLGYAKDRVFRIMISDPVKRVLIAQYVDLVGEN